MEQETVMATMIAATSAYIAGGEDNFFFMVVVYGSLLPLDLTASFRLPHF